MQNDIDLSTEALLKHRAIAEKSAPGPWAMGGETSSWVEDNEGNGICRMLTPESPRNTAIHIAANSPEVVKAHVDEILRLRAEVERLNKEADWLADHCREFCESYGYCGECPMFSGWLKRDHEDCGETVDYRGDKHTANWREAARKAVEEGVPHA